MFDYDVLIIGSGFGGSVSALRLAEKGLKVGVLEQGRRLSRSDLDRAGENATTLAWAPSLKRYGFLAQDIYQHVGIVRGIGVGGGSIVYAAVLLEPKTRFYQDPIWRHLSTDWQQELAPHYQTAKTMLGVNENPYQSVQDRWLKQTAQHMNAGHSYSAVPQGIYFGKAEEETPDPFFNGEGPVRRGCNLCGRCITGCSQGAKNSLDKNYLYFAEKQGAEILPESKVTHIEALAKGYIVHYQQGLEKPKSTMLTARHVILSAGVIGSLEILFASRDHYGTLPKISYALGQHVRTNSEAIVSIVSNDKDTDITRGTTISSHFYADEKTHITQNRFPASYNFMRFYMGPLVDEHQPFKRSFKTLSHLIFHPIQSSRGWRTAEWYKRVSVLTVMQQADNELSFSYGRTLLRGGKRALKSKVSIGERSPSYIPQANQAARLFAQISHGTAQNVLLESMGNLSVTAHILGGAVMADEPQRGVIDANHEVFGHQGLYIVDGSAIPVNVGVNPSLTITALAERFAERYLEKHSPKQKNLQEKSLSV